jgi:hypothetical protein
MLQFAELNPDSEHFSSLLPLLSPCTAMSSSVVLSGDHIHLTDATDTEGKKEEEHSDDVVVQLVN